jgi:hypothetical protein
MKRSLALALLLFSLGATAERPARVTVLEGDNLALNIVAASGREDIAAGDPLVAKARGWLNAAVKSSGEDEKAVAAQCERTSRWFFDLTRTRATTLEMLEALAVLGRAGTPMQDTLRDYVAARRQTADKSHAEAMAALRRTK